MLNDSADKANAANAEISKGTATFADNVLTLAGGTTIALTVTVLATNYLAPIRAGSIRTCDIVSVRR